MKHLEEIAFDNLVFLNDRDNFLANRYKISNQRFVKETDDDDNTIYSLSDLEYPLFFTFHQIMNHVHSSYEPTFYGKTKKELLNMFSIAIEVIDEYYVETQNSNKEFERLMDDIDDKVFFIQKYYKYGWCHRFPTFMKDNFNKFCKTLLVVSKEINRIHYNEFIRPHLLSDEEESADDSSDDSADNSAMKNESLDNEHTDDESSEDIPDLDESKHKDD